MIQRYTRKRVTNKELKLEFARSLNQDGTPNRMTDRFAELIMSLIYKTLNKKYSGFARQHDDMAMEIYLEVLKYWTGYKHDKGSVMTYILLIISTRAGREVQKYMRSRRPQQAARHRANLYDFGEQANHEYDIGLKEQGLRQGPRGYIVPISQTDDETAKKFGFKITEREQSAYDWQRGVKTDRFPGVLPLRRDLLNGMSYREMADKYGMADSSTINKWLIKHNLIEKPTPSQIKINRSTRKLLKTLACTRCGKNYETVHTQRRYCSKRCLLDETNERRRATRRTQKNA